MHPGHCNGSTGETPSLKSWWDEEGFGGKERGRGELMSRLWGLEKGKQSWEKEKRGVYECKVSWWGEKGIRGRVKGQRWCEVKGRCQTRRTDDTRQRFLEVDSTLHDSLLSLFSFPFFKDLVRMVKILQGSLRCNFGLKDMYKSCKNFWQKASQKWW